MSVLVFLLFFASSVHVLQPGTQVTGRISGGEKHSYEIELSGGDFARVIADQINIDIAMSVQTSDENEILLCDLENRNQGREECSFVADEAGKYRLEIQAALKRSPAGDYQVRLEDVRAATERDRLFYKANHGLYKAFHLLGDGNSDDALPVAEQALQIVEQMFGAESAEHARALNLVANVHAAKEDTQKAEPLYLRALQIREKVLGPEHPAVAETCIDLANFYNIAEDSAKAKSFAFRAVTIRERSLDTNHFLIGYALLDYGNYLIASQDFTKSEEVLKRSVLILQNSLGEDHPKYARALHSLGYMYDTVGDLTTAIDLYRRELTSVENANGKGSMPAAKVLNYIARVHYRRGEYEEAEALYQRALDINQKLKDENGILVAQSNLANIHLERGDYERSEAMYLEILEKREKAAKPIPMRIAHALVSLGTINNSQGDYKTAEAYLKRCLAIGETIWKTDTSEIGDILTFLGTAYIGLKDYSAAEQASRRALAAFEKAHGPNHPLVADALNVVAKIALLKNEANAAEPLFRRSLTIIEKSEGLKAPPLLEPLNGLADIYAGRRNFSEAVEYQARANEVVEHHLALAIAGGSERQKLNALQAYASNSDRNIVLNIQKAPENAKAAELAATSVLRFKGRVLDSMAETFSALRRHSDPDNQYLLDQLNHATRELAQQTLNAPELLTTGEYRKLEQEIEKLQDKISRRSAEFVSQKQPVTLEAIRKTIPDGAVLIEFALYHPNDANDLRYVAYVISKEGKVQSKELGPAVEIDRSVDQLREALRDPSRTDVNKLARTVHQKLMAPISPFLSDARQLLISPDGKLNLLPFEALLDQQNRYVVENFLCSYLTSGRDLLRLQVSRESKTDAVLVANPMFGGRSPLLAKGSDIRRSVTTGTDLSDVYFAPLSGTGEEARAIKSFFKDASVFSGTNATETRLKQIAAPRILHIATHGFFLTDIAPKKSVQNPLLRSGLAFAGANARHSGKDDGILTALEASGLNLWGTKLVTLSACDTGLGPVKNGEGVYGLRRAFVLSGAESIVMSLWSISDYTTREIMTGYYKNLKQGMGRAEALRNVQLSTMKRPKRTHPFFWAGFIQSGQWLPL